MTKPSWPASLPQFAQQGDYSEQTEKNLAEVARPVGDPLQRARSIINSETMAVSFIMSNVQIATFLDFFQNTLVDGTQRFIWNDPRHQTPMVFAFTEPPAYRTIGYRTYEVKCQLRREPYFSTSLPTWVMFGAVADIDFTNDLGWSFRGFDTLETMLTCQRSTTLSYAKGSQLLIDALSYGQDWGVWFATIASSTVVGPDGVTNARLFTTASGSAPNVRQSNLPTTAGATYTVSSYLKYGNQQYVAVGFSYYATSWFGEVVADLVNGTITAQNNATGTITDAGNGWYRVTATVVAPGTIFNDVEAAVFVQDAAGTHGGIAAGKTVYAGGTQFQTGAAATKFYANPLLSFGTNALRLTDLGLFMEEARVNQFLWSTDFSNAAWGRNNVKSAFSTASAPTGAVTGQKLAADLTLTLASLLSCTRVQNVTSYAENADGSLVSFASNTLRLTDQGLLVEQGGSNELVYSNDLTQASWSRTSMTVAASAVAARVGNYNRLTCSAGSGTKSIQQGGLGPTGSTTLSFDVRRVNTDWIAFQVWTGGGLTWFNTNTGAFGTIASGVTVRVRSIPNGGYRLTATQTWSTGFGAYVSIVSGNNSSTISASGTEAVDVGLFQLESAHAWESSYIPTTSVSQTRPSDVITGSGALTAALGANMTIVAAGTRRTSNVQLGDLICTSPVSAGSTTLLRDNGSAATVGWNASELSVGTWSAGALNRIGLAVDSSGHMSGSLNGANATTTSSSDYTGGATGIYIGSASPGFAQYFNDFITRVTVWNSKVADATLKTLTSRDPVPADGYSVDLNFLAGAYTFANASFYINCAASFGSSGTYTLSAYVKPAELSQFVLYMDDGGGVSVAYNFNLATLTATQFNLNATYWSSPSASIDAPINGWYRVKLTATAANAGVPKFARLILSDGGNDTWGIPVFGPNDGDGLYIWGAQVELGAFATSYIPTTSAPITRAGDIVTVTGTLLDVLGGASGTSSAITMILKTYKLQTGFSFPYFISHFGGDGIAPQSSNVAIGMYNGSTAVIASGNDITAGAVKTVFAGDDTSRSIATTGSAVGTLTGGLAPNSTPQFGSNSGARSINGYLQRATIINQRVTDTALLGLAA